MIEPEERRRRRDRSPVADCVGQARERVAAKNQFLREEKDQRNDEPGQRARKSVHAGEAPLRTDARGAHQGQPDEERHTEPEPHRQLTGTFARRRKTEGAQRQAVQTERESARSEQEQRIDRTVDPHLDAADPDRGRRNRGQRSGRQQQQDRGRNEGDGFQE